MVGATVKPRRRYLVPFDEQEAVDCCRQVARNVVAYVPPIVMRRRPHLPAVQPRAGLQPIRHAVAENVILNDVDEAVAGIVEQHGRGQTLAIGNVDPQPFALDPGVEILVQRTVFVESFLQPENIALSRFAQYLLGDIEIVAVIGIDQNCSLGADRLAHRPDYRHVATIAFDQRHVPSAATHFDLERTVAVLVAVRRFRCDQRRARPVRRQVQVVNVERSVIAAHAQRLGRRLAGNFIQQPVDGPTFALAQQVPQRELELAGPVGDSAIAFDQIPKARPEKRKGFSLGKGAAGTETRRPVIGGDTRELHLDLLPVECDAGVTAGRPRPPADKRTPLDRPDSGTVHQLSSPKLGAGARPCSSHTEQFARPPRSARP